jgi:hypothetical protein
VERRRHAPAAEELVEPAERHEEEGGDELVGGSGGLVGHGHDVLRES